MRKLFGCLLFLAILVLCLGFFLGWFKLTTTSKDNKVNFNLTVDKDKIKADEEKTKRKLDETRKQLEKKNKDPADR